MVPAATAHLQLRAIVQNNHVVAASCRTELLDPVDIDYCRSVDTDEFVGIEFTFDFLHRCSMQIGFVLGVDLNIVVRRSNPVDTASIEKNELPIRTYYEA